MVADYLEDHGLVDFGTAKSHVEAFFAEGRTILRRNEPGALVTADLMHLNAAEIELGRSSRSPQLPLQVSDAAARRAVFLTDSGPFVGHDPQAHPHLWDATLYGSDASKLAWLAETDSVEAVAEKFLPTVHRLAALDDDRPDERAYGDRQSFAVRATLWRAKISVLLNETNLEPLLTVHSSLNEPEFA